MAGTFRRVAYLVGRTNHLRTIPSSVPVRPARGIRWERPQAGRRSPAKPRFGAPLAGVPGPLQASACLLPAIIGILMFAGWPSNLPHSRRARLGGSFVRLSEVPTPTVFLSICLGREPAELVMHSRHEPVPHPDLRPAGPLICLVMGKHSPVEEGDHVRGLHKAAGRARREVQRVHDPRQLAVAVANRAHLAVAGQVSAVLSLTVRLVCDHQRVSAEAGNALINTLQQVLQHHRVRRLGGAIPRALPYDVHRTSDHLDVLPRNGLDNVVEDTDSGANRHAAPGPTSMEDLVAVQLHPPTSPYAWAAAAATRSSSAVSVTDAGPSTSSAAIANQSSV